MQSIGSATKVADIQVVGFQRQECSRASVITAARKKVYSRKKPKRSKALDPKPVKEYRYYPKRPGESVYEPPPALGLTEDAIHFNRFMGIFMTPQADKLVFENNTYVLKVHINMEKPAIKKMFEETFKVDVIRIETMNRGFAPDKTKREFYQIWTKKVYITVAEGQYPFAKLTDEGIVEKLPDIQETGTEDVDALIEAESKRQG